MKESIEDFEKRSYVVSTAYPNPYVLVWKTKEKKGKAEKYDWQTYLNYIAYLKA